MAPTVSDQGRRPEKGDRPSGQRGGPRPEEPTREAQREVEERLDRDYDL